LNKKTWPQACFLFGVLIDVPDAPSAAPTTRLLEQGVQQNPKKKKSRQKTPGLLF
jgi:hypothetical protein